MSRILPILFNTEMVQAILDGRKTVTRRVMKPANPFRNREGYSQGDGLWIDGYSKNDEPNGHIKDYSVSSCWMLKNHYIDKYAPYRPGDIMYVRETWCRGSLDYQEEQYYYKADNNSFSCRWHPSIHMPKAAARIWLEVKGVGIERLQDIDDEGVVAEGLQIGSPFDELWDFTIKKADRGKFGWDANPWIWVIKFKRCGKPESKGGENERN